ncbi:MAG: type I DNA topoisomerase [Planctomycetes bacterium]|nr:type I DNA topoisomerase [Planctomycetota bacterium]
MVGKSLVIVESPTKAKTIASFLRGRDYVVESSVGHIRDLPSSAKEVPEEIKGKPWANLGIDVENDFEPVYVVPSEKKKTVAKLRKLLKEASALYLATDEDREGESISWHLLEVLKPRVPRKRLVFHEITREAIEAALRNPRDIDSNLVEAQETRRKLDRLYGYEVSPVLWRKIAPRLSAGRVQSVAVRIIVEREEERRAFLRSAYWDLAARFRTEAGQELEAVLVTLGGKRLAAGKDFDGRTGRLRDDVAESVVLVTQERAEELARSLGSQPWKVSSVERKPTTRRPEPPFTTSTLQQEANRKLRLSSRDTMRAAQRLYESGYITYMRTDSTTLSEQAVRRARKLIGDLYGADFLPAAPREYVTRVKNAQEAHEAIRPAGDFRRPEEVRGEVGETELKVYELIWKRTVACQMADARGQNIAIQVSGEKAGGQGAGGPGAGDESAVFQANGKTIEFPGFLRAYVEGADDPEAELADQEKLLPDVSPGERLACRSLEAKSHTTKPPDRYTEASLIKELEADGIGRPSTYASIIDTILRREYVVKQGNSLVPTFMAFAVVGLLKKKFTDLVDIQFTARMEEDLDAISLGEKKALPYLRGFYFGTKEKAGLHRLIQTDIDPREACTLPIGRDSAGRQVNVRIGRFGPYLERGEERANIPAGLAPDELTVPKAEELFLQSAQGPRKVGDDPVTGKPIYAKLGRFGPYVQLGENEDEPRMKSLLPGMTPEGLTLEEALRLLSLPRSLGVDPETSEEVFADFGRFGPYVKRGSESRSLPRTDDVFSVSLERAVEVLKTEKKGWRSRAPAVLRELGVHPGSGAPIKLLDGRYGPYVTDGTTNANVPRGSSPESLTLDRALELLRARAEDGPRPRRGRFAARGPAKHANRRTVAREDAGPRVAAPKKTARRKRTGSG